MEIYSNDDSLEQSILSLRQLDRQHKGVQIDVEHVSYSVQTGEKKVLTKILEDVSFKMIPGTLTALMGPSGAGKR
jgi:ABC-type multidrug transport system ATPase subunit